MLSSYQLRRGSWQEFAEQCAELRKQVFFNEARYSYFATLDGRDGLCNHVLAVADDQQVLGCGRIERGSWLLSRIAVLPAARQHGIGTALLNELVAIARDGGAGEVGCAVPVFSVEYYRRQHFEPVGSVYHEAEVPYQRMRLALAAATRQSRPSVG